MTELTEKETVLEAAGYRYDFSRMIYVSQDRRRVFSLEFVEDHPLEEIRKLAVARSKSQGWTIHFNEAPSASTKRDLVQALR